MKRLFLTLLVSLIAFLPGCGLEREAGNGTISAETIHPSDTPSEDCQRPSPGTGSGHGPKNPA